MPLQRDSNILSLDWHIKPIRNYYCACARIACQRLLRDKRPESNIATHVILYAGGFFNQPVNEILLHFAGSCYEHWLKTLVVCFYLLP